MRIQRPFFLRANPVSEAVFTTVLARGNVILGQSEIFRRGSQVLGRGIGVANVTHRLGHTTVKTDISRNSAYQTTEAALFLLLRRCRIDYFSY
jgi:hypothetical protein